MPVTKSRAVQSLRRTTSTKPANRTVTARVPTKISASEEAGLARISAAEQVAKTGTAGRATAKKVASKKAAIKKAAIKKAAIKKTAAKKAATKKTAAKKAATKKTAAKKTAAKKITVAKGASGKTVASTGAIKQAVGTKTKAPRISPRAEPEAQAPDALAIQLPNSPLPPPQPAPVPAAAASAATVSVGGMGGLFKKLGGMLTKELTGQEVFAIVSGANTLADALIKILSAAPWISHALHNIAQLAGAQLMTRIADIPVTNTTMREEQRMHALQVMQRAMAVPDYLLELAKEMLEWEDRPAEEAVGLSMTNAERDKFVQASVDYLTSGEGEGLRGYFAIYIRLIQLKRRPATTSRPGGRPHARKRV